MNLLIFQNLYEFLQFFYVYENSDFEKKIKTMIVQVLVQSPRKYLFEI